RVRQRRRRARFSQETRRRFPHLFGFVRVEDDLERDAPMKPRVDGEVDRAHAARAEERLDRVMRELVTSVQHRRVSSIVSEAVLALGASRMPEQDDDRKRAIRTMKTYSG